MKYRGEVVDLFCGIGSLSHGLKLSCFKILAGYDIDSPCKHAYKNNNKARFYTHDVAKLAADEVRTHYIGERPSVLAGYASCQPFSSYKHRYEEKPKWDLVTKFAKLAVEVNPDFITMGKRTRASEIQNRVRGQEILCNS